VGRTRRSASSCGIKSGFIRADAWVLYWGNPDVAVEAGSGTFKAFTVIADEAEGAAWCERFAAAVTRKRFFAGMPAQ
jgi:hypothetical protein